MIKALKNLLKEKDVGGMIYIGRKDCDSAFINTMVINGKLTKMKEFDNMYRIKSPCCDFIFFESEVKEIKDKVIFIRINK